MPKFQVRPWKRRPLYAGVLEDANSQWSRLVLLDRDSALADLDLDAGRLAFFLINIDAETDDENHEGTDDQIEAVPVHSLPFPLRMMAHSYEAGSDPAREEQSVTPMSADVYCSPPQGRCKGRPSNLKRISHAQDTQ